MPDLVSIRSATADDIPKIARLVREYWAFEGIAGFDLKRVSGVLRGFFADAALGGAWIAEIGDRPVGYLLACYVFSLEHGGLTAEIDELFVLPGYREAGLGRRLLQTAEPAFEEAGCANVALQLGRHNDAARAFYARLGYRPRAGYELMDKMLAPRTAGPAKGRRRS